MFHQTSWTPDKKLIMAFVFILLFNTLDGALTIWGFRIGAIEEANPFMDLLLAKSPMGVMAVKVFLPIILGLALWHGRKKSSRLVMFSTRLVLSVYALVALLHVRWLFYCL